MSIDVLRGLAGAFTQTQERAFRRIQSALDAIASAYGLFGAELAAGSPAYVNATAAYTTALSVVAATTPGENMAIAATFSGLMTAEGAFTIGQHIVAQLLIDGVVAQTAGATQIATSVNPGVAVVSGSISAYVPIGAGASRTVQLQFRNSSAGTTFTIDPSVEGEHVAMHVLTKS